MGQPPTSRSDETTTPLFPTTAATNNTLDPPGPALHKAQKVFPLLDLPVELIQNIAQHLAGPQLSDSSGQPHWNRSNYDPFRKDSPLADDFLTFHLTCSWINDATFAFFRRKYLTSRKVIMKFESLKDLVNLAHHPKLGRQIQSLRILPFLQDSGEIFQFESIEEEYRRNRAMKRSNYDQIQWSHIIESFDKLREKIRTTHDNNQHMRELELAPILLQRALSRFGGLRNIEFGYNIDKDWKMAKLWEAAKMQEIEPMAKYSSLFAHMNGGYPEEWLAHQSDALDIVIDAITKSKVSLSSLRLEDGSLRLPDGSFQLQSVMMRTPSEAPVLQECLQKLSSLHLSFGTMFADFNHYGEGLSINYVLELLSAAPRTLEELRISYELNPQYMFHWYETTERIVAVAPLCNELFSKIRFLQLEKLSIRCTWETITGVAQLISRHAGSLKAVEFDQTVPRKGHPNHEIWTSELVESDLEVVHAEWSKIFEACLQCDNLVNVDIYPETKYEGTELTDIVSSHRLSGQHMLSEGVKSHGHLSYRRKEEYHKLSAEGDLEPRAKYLKRMLEQHLCEWKAAELVHGV